MVQIHVLFPTLVEVLFRCYGLLKSKNGIRTIEHGFRNKAQMARFLEMFKWNNGQIRKYEEMERMREIKKI